METLLIHDRAKHEFEEACRRGIFSTPAVFINGISTPTLTEDPSLRAWREVLEGALRDDVPPQEDYHYNWDYSADVVEVWDSVSGSEEQGNQPASGDIEEYGVRFGKISERGDIDSPLVVDK